MSMVSYTNYAEWEGCPTLSRSPPPQKQFSELLMKAASDYGALTASVADFQWSLNFKEPPTLWKEMLRLIPVALAACTRFFEASTAMKESYSTTKSRPFDSSLLEDGIKL